MPYSSSLEGWLRVLDLRGTRDLHIFDSHLNEGSGANRLKNQAFFVLENVLFRYHAHCCQLKRSNYSYLEPDFSPRGKKRESSSLQHIFQRLYDYFLGGAAPHSSQYPGIVSQNDDPSVERRYKRQTTNTADDSLTCLNYTELNIVLFPDSDNTGRETNNSADLLEGWFFDANSTDLICTENEIVNITTQVYRSCVDESPSSHTSTISAVPPTATTIQTDTVPAATLPLSTMTTDSLTPVDCIVEVFCTLTATLLSTTMPSTTSPPTLPSCNCHPEDYACTYCTDFDCEDDIDICGPYQYICDGNCSPSGKRRRRHTMAVREGARMKRDTANTILPEGWFYPNPDNTTIACITISDNTTINNTLAMMTIPTPTVTVALPATTVPVSRMYTPTCQTEIFPLNEMRFRLREVSTLCTPLEDPFNPCEDLLGRGHILRSFIWITIILALVGNFLVITVFLGYTVILKRTEVKHFVVDFLYFNLAVADFLMGIYLFTIAVQDLRTLGNFSMFDVAWRTEGGCDFAGFCAITSTVVSVYVLFVITAERLYTFSRPLHKSHPSKTTVIILMAVGWGFGVLMGILPVITNDVNDYSRTAICLPFDVSSKLTLSYILFLLLFTGVVFMAIAICYIIIFCQVFYCRKVTSVSDKKRWKMELKVALRMGTLVFTNFVCWFPIALLGISAAVGNSLVDNITFAKWVMVFIFPINACLNPILYSILSKVFRDNLVLILGKCGLCGRRVSKIKRHRAGFTPSSTSKSKAYVISNNNVMGGTLKEQLWNFCITSATNCLGKRSQASSEECYRIDQTLAKTNCSSEDITVNSQHGNTISSGSMEVTTTFSNLGFRSNSLVGGSTIANGVAENYRGCSPQVVNHHKNIDSEIENDSNSGTTTVHVA